MTFNTGILPECQAVLLLKQLEMIFLDTIYCHDSSCVRIPTTNSSLLSISPAKEIEIPSPVDLLHQFVETKAQQTPSHPAFEFATRTSEEILTKRVWSYQDLDSEGNRYAHLLQRRGALYGEFIGICFDKSPESYLSILGILKVGCAYVAIDPSAPVARKDFILRDSRARLVLCTTEQKSDFETLADITVIAVDDPEILMGLPSTSIMLDREIQPNDTCYCLYTSGTTGVPKGCEISHKNAVQAMLSFQRLFDGHWNESSRWLQFASFHFDVSVLEQYWSWSVGICVTSCPRDILFEDLPGTIKQLGITHIDLTPSLAQLVRPQDAPSLCDGVFITGGESLRQEILDSWGDYGVIYNGYGPTEVTIGCTMLPRATKNTKPSNIGSQFDNVGAFVLRPGTTEPVLRGGVGELCVSGALVGHGYLNRPHLTEERFPYLKNFDTRVYRTGDLVRILYDGNFCFLGRFDDQIKLRGQRLEIGEINEAITGSSPEIGQVVTTVIRRLEQSEEQLVSFFTTIQQSKSRLDNKIDITEKNLSVIDRIKRACRSKLSGYMVPTHVIPLTSIPLSNNNKVDMHQIKTIFKEMTLNDLQLLSQTPNKPMHVKAHVKEIISLVARAKRLDAAAVLPESSIFDLGFDSISVISLSRILKESGYNSARPSLILKSKRDVVIFLRTMYTDRIRPYSCRSSGCNSTFNIRLHAKESCFSKF